MIADGLQALISPLPSPGQLTIIKSPLPPQVNPPDVHPQPCLLLASRTPALRPPLSRSCSPSPFPPSVFPASYFLFPLSVPPHFPSSAPAEPSPARPAFCYSLYVQICAPAAIAAAPVPGKTPGGTAAGCAQAHWAAGERVGRGFAQARPVRASLRRGLLGIRLPAPSGLGAPRWRHYVS